MSPDQARPPFKCISPHKTFYMHQDSYTGCYLRPGFLVVLILYAGEDDDSSTRAAIRHMAPHLGGYILELDTCRSTMMSYVIYVMRSLDP